MEIEAAHSPSRLLVHSSHIFTIGMILGSECLRQENESLGIFKRI